jgi:SIR2-like domain
MDSPESQPNEMNALTNPAAETSIQLPQRRMFVLGAGFSRAADLPLAAQLGELAFTEVTRIFGSKTKFHSSLEEYREYRRSMVGAIEDEWDIEDFATYLDYQHSFGMLGSDTWSEEGNIPQLMLRWAIGRALHLRTPPADRLPPVYLHFARNLNPGDVVVTFNYDLIVELALTGAGVRFRRFPYRCTRVRPGYCETGDPRDEGEVVLYKPHGSLDWVSRRHHDRLRTHLDATAPGGSDRDLVFGQEPVTTWRPLVEGPRPVDDPLTDICVLEDIGTYYAHENTYLTPPLLLAPSFAKGMYGVELRPLWRGLGLQAWFWGGLVFIGLSLRLADAYIRQLLYDLSGGYVTGFQPGWSFSAKDRIKLVDLRGTPEGVAALAETYRFLDWQYTDVLLGGFNEAGLAGIFGTQLKG